jgi:agmatine deiminase
MHGFVVEHGPFSLARAAVPARGSGDAETIAMSAKNLSSTGPGATAAAGYTFPAEWTLHRTCYSAWPAHDYAWGSGLRAAQREYADFAPEAVAEAQSALADSLTHVRLQPFEYGDIWLRDTAPLFMKGAAAEVPLLAARFQFNGWGEKYIYPHDDTLAARLAELRGVPSVAHDFVLEGGAIDVDGAGTCLTTRSCLQNANRGAPSSETVAARLRATLGIQHLIWLDAGLANDHTDGHVDNIARFIAEGVVVCMQAQDPDDPNRDALEAIADTLRQAHTASGQPLRVERIPSPGRVIGSDGQVVPASYMNFYIGNRSVVMPSFGTRWDAPAQTALQKLFRQRQVVASSARAILEGGGTFHCMTQQEPLP